MATMHATGSHASRGTVEILAFRLGSFFDDGECTHKSFPIQEPIKEEFSDWPHGLLAIGTFGMNQFRDDSGRLDSSEERNSSFNASNSSHHPSDFTEEEVGKLQKELTKLLALKPAPNAAELREGQIGNLPLDKFLNCPSSLEVDRTVCKRFCDDLDGEDGDDISRTGSVTLRKDKGVCADENNAIRRKSLSFLLKKMLACRGGLAPTPSLRDPIPESRIDKLIRKILEKKIYPQNSGSLSTTKKYLVHKRTAKMKEVEDSADGKENEGYKWVKTDSEFIVLEM